MTTQRNDDETLEALFGAARAEAQPLSDDLFARIMADAVAVDTARAVPQVRAAPRGWLASFGAMLGGWPSVAGLATAAMAGVWIGVAQPVALDGLGLSSDTTQTGYELQDLMPGFDVLASEG
jgi:hypothetical protein